jgi:hypothetical protein
VVKDVPVTDPCDAWAAGSFLPSNYFHPLWRMGSQKFKISDATKFGQYLNIGQICLLYGGKANIFIIHDFITVRRIAQVSDYSS